MKDVLLYGCILISGAALGWLGGTYQQAKATRNAVQLFKVIELDSADKRAKQAYAKQPRNVAIWELTHLVELLEDALKAKYDGPKSVNLRLFLAHARLARLMDLEGNQTRAQAHCQKAIDYYNESHPDAKIEDCKTMLGRLKQFDEIANVTH